MTKTLKLLAGTVVLASAMPGMAQEYGLKNAWGYIFAGYNISLSSRVNHVVHQSGYTVGAGYAPGWRPLFGPRDGEASFELGFARNTGGFSRFDEYHLFYVDRIPFSSHTDPNRAVSYWGLGLGITELRTKTFTGIFFNPFFQKSHDTAGGELLFGEHYPSNLFWEVSLTSALKTFGYYYTTGRAYIGFRF